MKLSIVSTLYKSEGTVAEFVRRASAAALAITESYEIVLVDDGSPDGALAIAVALASTDPHLKVVELSRNFGHHKSLMTGLKHARGDYCFLIDSDLEEAPELLAEFWAKLHDEDKDVVYGFQARRLGGWARPRSTPPRHPPVYTPRTYRRSAIRNGTPPHPPPRAAALQKPQ